MNPEKREARALLAELQLRLGHEFLSGRLLEEALTHSSFQGGGGRKGSNERLEFLGDRVLGLVVASLLFERFPNEEVGALARRHASLVRRETLAQIALDLGLADCIRLSRGEEDAGGRQNPGLLSDACEALIAAVYLDAGHEVADRVVRTLWLPLVDRDASPPKDAKTMLQEWSQGQGRALPHYRETERIGPPHAPTFLVEVVVEGLEPVIASGPSKRSAERAAAESMMAKVRLLADESGRSAR